MQRVIVTGGAGFVGGHLSRQLQVENRAEVLVIDDFRTGTFANLNPPGDDVPPFTGDVVTGALHDIDLPSLISRFRPDAIFHEASITDTTIHDEAVMMHDNVAPFRVLLDTAIAHAIPLVWASSAATYGQTARGATLQHRPFQVNDAGDPANVYGFSKWVMENLHRQALAVHPDAHVVGLRYFNVFGTNEGHKGKMASMVHQLALQILDGRPPRIFYDGEQARDQVPVWDVVDATIAATGPEAHSGIYNVGSGTATTFNQIINALNEALGTDHAPDYFENPYAFYQDFTCADLKTTGSGIQWQPSHDVRDAILRTARALQARHAAADGATAVVAGP